MNIFQIFLILAIVISSILLIRTRTLIYRRVFSFILIFIGIFFVIFPDSSTMVAKFVGIGRGTDLIFYIFIIFSWFSLISISAKIRRIDRILTLLVREKAIANPEININNQQTEG